MLIGVMENIVQAEELRVGAYNYPPFMISKSKTGIFNDILIAIGRITGDTFVWSYFPYARLNKNFNNGLFDIEAGSSPAWTKSRKVPGLHTIPYYVLKDVIVFQQGKQVPFKSPIDLQGYKVGVVRGYAFPQFTKAFEQKLIARIDAVDETQLLRMLDHNRIDQIFVNKDLLLYWTKQIPAYKKFEIGAVIGSYEIGIRVQPDKKHLITRFNKAIEQIRYSGEIERIFKKYR